ncbi:MAG: L-rhamnose mutarotase [Acutalibacteraceae bacterium]|jgi:L-rhamnose mutarotase
MERYAWRAKVRQGMLDEYIERHDKIWPEMLELLKEAGIKNYTIWNNGDDLFGYYECELGVQHAAMIQASSPIVEKWNEYMKDVMVMETDPVTGAQPLMKQVFFME